MSLDTTTLKEKLTDFFKNQSKFQEYNPVLNLSFKEIAELSPEIAEALIENPQELIPHIKQAYLETCQSENKTVELFLENFYDSELIELNRIRSKHLAKLIKVRGMIHSRTSVLQKEALSKYECPACGVIIQVIQINKIIMSPKKCNCSYKGKFRKVGSEFQDYFNLTIEALPEDLINLENAAHLEVEFSNTFADKDYNIQVGSRIELCGYLKEYPVIKNQQETTTIDKVLICCGFKIIDGFEIQAGITPEEQVLFEDIAAAQNPAKFISELIFSDIIGWEKEREACILAAASPIQINGQRGTIHVLLLGDPAVGKSQIGKITAMISPLGKLVFAKNATSAGLTITIKENKRDGGYIAQAGLIPKYNRGLIVLDEYDKLSPEDRLSMLSAMEDGYCDVTKAGLSVHLSAFTSIVSLSNFKVSNLQNEVQPEVLSRFDFVYEMLDVIEPLRDAKICTSIQKRYTSPSIIDTSMSKNNTYIPTFRYKNNIYSLLSIKKYLQIVKDKVKNSFFFANRYEKTLLDLYLAMRSKAEGYYIKKVDPRFVASIQRIAASMATLKGRNIITIHEVKQAINYLIKDDFEVKSEDVAGE